MTEPPYPPPGCLLYGAKVEPRPHPSFLGGRSWTCDRCDKTFSEPNPTRIGYGKCPFDRQEPAA